MPRYSRGGGSNDPRWITVQFGSPTCSRCKATIRKGTRAFYYPSTKIMLCWSDDCGVQESNQFNAALHTQPEYKFEAVFYDGSLVTIIAGWYQDAREYAQELARERGTTLHSIMNVF